MPLCLWYAQDPSEAGSWVYQTDRPLLHACLSALRSRVLELQHQVQLQHQLQHDPSASAATSPTQLTDGLTAEDGDLSTLAHFPPPPPHTTTPTPNISAHHNPRTPYPVDPLGLADREAAMRAHHHPPAPLLGDLRSDALSSAFSEGGADHAGSLSELSLDSPLVGLILKTSPASSFSSPQKPEQNALSSRLPFSSTESERWRCLPLWG